MLTLRKVKKILDHYNWESQWRSGTDNKIFNLKKL